MPCHSTASNLVGLATLSIQNPLLRSVLFLLLALLLFDTQGLIIKHLGGQYSVQQLTAYRNFFGLFPSIMVLMFYGRGKSLRLRQWRLALGRGFFIAGAQFCFYLAIIRLEFATATTLIYIGPVLISVLSIPILGHRVNIGQWVAVLLGFVGVILIMQPGGDLFSPYFLLPVLAAFLYGLSTVCARLFEEGISTPLIYMYASCGALLGSVVILFSTGNGVTAVATLDWLWMFAMGFAGGFAVLAMIHAYRLSKPASLAPFEFFGIPLAVFLGWLFFNEKPFGQLLPGALFIAGGGLLISWIESRSKTVRKA